MTDSIEVTAADREAANKAFDVAFQGNTDTIDDDMFQILAAHRLATEQASDKLVVEFARSWCIKNSVYWGPLFDALLAGEHRRK